MIRARTFGLLTLVLPLLAISCSSGNPSSDQSGRAPLIRGNGGVYTAADAGRTISVQVGERFDLVLKSNPSTGYHWTLAQTPDGEVVRLYRNEYTAQTPQRIGGGGHDTWTFRAVSPGVTVLKMQYVSPDGRRIAEELTYNLIVH